MLFQSEDDDEATVMREVTLAFAVLAFASIIIIGVIIIVKIGTAPAPAMSDSKL